MCNAGRSVVSVDTGSVVLPRLLVMVRDREGPLEAGFTCHSFSIGNFTYVLVGLVLQSSSHYVSRFRVGRVWFHYDDQLGVPERIDEGCVWEFESRFRLRGWYFQREGGATVFQIAQPDGYDLRMGGLNDIHDE